MTNAIEREVWIENRTEEATETPESSGSVAVPSGHTTHMKHECHVICSYILKLISCAGKNTLNSLY
jgi:hypothetical protein